MSEGEDASSLKAIYFRLRSPADREIVDIWISGWLEGFSGLYSPVVF
jgi:hypothetical protein